MVNFLIRWSLEHRLAVLLLAGVLILGGAYVTSRMPVDVFPDLTAPTVTVIVEGHGISPKEMETQVTFPIEAAVNGAPDVRRVRSGTAIGIAVVWVEFEWGTDIFRARQTVAERIATVADSLPPQVTQPKLAPASSIMGEILFLSLTSPTHDLLELRTIATTQMRRRLLSVAGVSQVTAIGGDTRQYQVVLSPERLRAFGIAPAEVARALEETNENVAAGVVVNGAQETIVEGIGRVRTPDDIGKTVIAMRGDRPVRIADVGAVGVNAAFKRGVGSASRRGPNWEPIIEPGVIVAIQKQPGANTIELTKELDRALDEIGTSLPAGVTVNKNLFRQSQFIENSVRNTSTALLEGAVVVTVIVIAFLASSQASLITLLALPLSLFTALIVLRAFGGTINTMTLGGMAIAIGALVDDAIIDVENVVRRLRENNRLPAEKQRPTLDVIYDASVEVRSSIVLATFIIVLVFTPIFFLSGVEGRLLQPLGIAFTVALAASLLTALTVTPVLCSLFLSRSRTVRSGSEPALVHWLKKLYARPLDFVMRHPIAITFVSGVLFVGTMFASTTLGRGFLPEFNEGALVVGLVTVPGTSLQQSDELARLVDEALMRHPEIAAIGRRTGRAEEDEHVQGVEASEIDLTLDMEAPVRLGRPRRSKQELLEALRVDLAMVPGVQATFGQPISHRIDHMLSGTRASIAVKIFGDDLETLRSLGTEVEGLMRTVPGVVDLSTEQQAQVPTLRVEFDRDAIARHGLRIADVAHALELATTGEVVGQVLEGHNSFELLVRVGEISATSAESIAETLVETPGGAKLPLKALASLSEDRSPNFISRENVQRKIVVMCNVAGRDVGSVVADIRQAIQSNATMPHGYYVEYGGQFESAESTTKLLTFLGVVIVAGIAGLLQLTFRSTRDALFILLNLPLALMGGVAGVHFSGGTLSVASLIGFITVFGVAARNGIMMLSHIRHLQVVEGVTSFRDAVRQGAMERLAPILMTALAAGLALAPLALRGEEPGNEILTPMAIVILCGLLSSTLLNMLVVPSVFVRFGKSATRSESGATSVETHHA